MTKRSSLRCRSLPVRSRQLGCGIGDGTEIRRVEIIFSGNANEREKRIRPGDGPVYQGSKCSDWSHAIN
jgi:hypothetical protein